MRIPSGGGRAKELAKAAKEENAKAAAAYRPGPDGLTRAGQVGGTATTAITLGEKGYAGIKKIGSLGDGAGPAVKSGPPTIEAADAAGSSAPAAADVAGDAAAVAGTTGEAAEGASTAADMATTVPPVVPS